MEKVTLGDISEPEEKVYSDLIGIANLILWHGSNT